MFHLHAGSESGVVLTQDRSPVHVDFVLDLQKILVYVRFRCMVQVLTTPGEI
jgi:hypothetical protein